MPTLYQFGDSLKAHKIVATARKVSARRVNHRTSNDKSQFIDLKNNAYCVIDTPFTSEIRRKK